jgi:hypothetical protein
MSICILLITPLALDITLAGLGLMGVLVLLGVFYRLILYPVLQVMADTASPPPAPGEKKELVLKNGRHLRYRIGLLDSDWKLRMKGIVEDHLVLDFKKDRNLEEYEIDLIPGGQILYRAPHERHLQLMKGKERIESRELIGHPALFRLVAAMQGERPVHYVEFELLTRYFIDNAGDERMKFIIELKRIHPGIDLKSRSKRGIYQFGRSSEETSSYEE